MGKSSATSELTQPGLDAEHAHQRVGGIDLTAGIGVEQGDDPGALEKAGGVQPPAGGERPEATPIGTL